MQTPRPTPSESFDHYSIRASRELFAAVRDPFERMKVIRNTWRRHRGATAEEQLAERCFGKDRYQRADDICVFAEHETTDQQGQPRKYDLKKLARIVRYCNDRAREHQAFAAIADQHTSNPGDPNPAQPRVLGYVGPYRLGLIGDRKPTWAIFADEYRFPGEQGTFQQRNRRSVELWTDKKTGRMWFDPITTCGADAPRLPLPAHYSAFRKADMELERYCTGAQGFCSPARYEAGGFTAPGGAGVSPQTPIKFAADAGAPTQDPNPGGEPMGDDGQLTIEKIVEAVMALPPIQWAMQKMAEPEPGPGGMDQLTPPSPSAAGPAPGPAPGAVPPAPGAPPGPADGPPAPGEGDDLGDLDDLLGDEPAPDAGPQAADEDPDKEKDSMAAYTAKTLDDLTKENYSLRKSQDALVRQFGEAQSQLKTLQRESADAKRVARYTQFRADHPNFPTDDDELKTCLYSQGANMSDQQFNAHMATLEKYAAKWVANVQIPTGEADRPSTDATKEDYSQRRMSKAIELYQVARGTDQELDWGQALARADEALKG